MSERTGGKERATNDASATIRSFDEALRKAIERRGLSLSTIHRRLVESGNPGSTSALSYWRTGQRVPEGAHSRAAIAELETILGLDAGSLGDPLGGGRRAGRISPPDSPYSDPSEAQVLAEMLEILDADLDSSVREISSTSIAHVGKDGGVRAYTTRTLVRALRSNVRSLPLLLPIPADTHELPDFYAIGGGSVGLQKVHPSNTMIGARFELDAPVNAPDTALFEIGLRFPDSFPPVRDAGKGVTRKARELVVWVHFDQDAIPRDVVEFEETADGELTRPLLRTSGSVHAVREDFGPGVFGIRWGDIAEH